MPKYKFKKQKLYKTLYFSKVFHPFHSAGIVSLNQQWDFKAALFREDKDFLMFQRPLAAERKAV